MAISAISGLANGTGLSKRASSPRLLGRNRDQRGHLPARSVHQPVASHPGLESSASEFFSQVADSIECNQREAATADWMLWQFVFGLVAAILTLPFKVIKGIWRAFGPCRQPQARRLPRLTGFPSRPALGYGRIFASWSSSLPPA